MKKGKIKILKNGPYKVTGAIPLSEKIITSNNKENEYKDGRELQQSEEYYLCRCGATKNSPFCDRTHNKVEFEGKEEASRENFMDRAEKIEGPNLDLYDDDRCAFARFCHRDEGNVWELIEKSDDPKLREEAIKAACDCPAGRLVVVDKEGEVIEPVYETSIEILQDYGRGASGPIFVKGGIPIEGSDDFTYDVRNRVALCRCGKSRNKPFCDATHISIQYKDR